LLIVGPLPPPVGGATVYVQALVAELTRRAIVPVVVDTSPRSCRKKTQLARWETLARGVRILRHYLQELGRCDAVIVCFTNALLLTLGCPLVLAARVRRTPVYLKPFGADLGTSISAHGAIMRAYLTTILRAATGVLAETRQLQAELIALRCTNTGYVPNHRPALAGSLAKRSRGELQLISLSQIMHEKGPFLLLDALQRLAAEGQLDVRCDFYGPVLNEDRSEFFERLAVTPGARYCGVVEPGNASMQMTAYDALAFPTAFVGEGHPGVIIEAMQAGLPIISTRHRAIPELVTDGENGLLIPVGDCDALVAAIRRLALDRAATERMGRASQRRAKDFCSDVVVSQLLTLLFHDARSLVGNRRAGQPIESRSR
jgi:glycosyltransferase involved in cell wall biosynthesis